MKAGYYIAIIALLVAGLAFSSYLAYAYLYVLYGFPPSDEQETYLYRMQICDLQRQLGYEACHVDGQVISFDEIGNSDFR